CWTLLLHSQTAAPRIRPPPSSSQTAGAYHHRSPSRALSTTGTLTPSLSQAFLPRLSTALYLSRTDKTHYDHIHGASHINPIKAFDPGLVYDIEPQEYFEFLCTHKLRMRSFFASAGDLNYPAISVVFQRSVSTVHITVTNVGPATSKYHIIVLPLDLNCKDSMGTEFETVEGRITSMLPQLQYERGILERLVYKNKNQHRRCSYFQHLLKVRRDLRLLQLAKLEELVTSCFNVIKGDRPKQKIHLLESEISVLFARSFFMGLSVTIMALLARLRVLVQQILLDLVYLFNTVSSLSKKKQSVKITHDGIEVFREFYPISDDDDDYITLECVWKSEKYILRERKHKRENESQGEDSGENLSVQPSGVNYNTIDSILGDDQLDPERGDADAAAEQDHSHVKDMNTDLLPALPQIDEVKETVFSIKEGGGNRSTTKQTVFSSEERGENCSTTQASLCESAPEGDLRALSQSSTSGKLHSSSKKVAFVSIKNPKLAPQSVQSSISVLTSNAKAKAFHFMGNESDQTKDDKGDSLANIFTNNELDFDEPIKLGHDGIILHPMA
ncbi:hypothetical protein TSUD_120870, partial [Trifolium subterraneum]